MIKWLKTYKWELIFLVIVLLSLYFILPVSIPLVLALITAIALNPFVNYLYSKTKWNRNISVIIVFILFILIIVFYVTVFITKATVKIIFFVAYNQYHFNTL